MLLDEAKVTEGMLSTLESLYVQLTHPRETASRPFLNCGGILFCKHRAESDKLPPTPGALKQHNHESPCLNKGMDTSSHCSEGSIAGSPEKWVLQTHYGHAETNDYRTTEVLPDPKAILEMVQCKCKSDCSSSRCSYKAKPVLTCIIAAASSRTMMIPKL
jgi:hypothetical protein